MDFIDRAIKGIKVTAVILVVVTILSFAIGGYYNYKFYKGIISDPMIDEADTTIAEWISEYQYDIVLQEQWQRDFEEAKVRLEKLGVEFDEVAK